MLIPITTRTPAVCALLLALTLITLLLTPIAINAAPSPVIETCYNNGCNRVFSILDPCGGGATNETLQQSLIFTPTDTLGACECNYEFYITFSSCLACISSQANSFPEIQNQQDWVENCNDYGFNFTASPLTNSTNGIGGNDNNSNNGGGGLSTGAIVGIVLGALVVVGLVGAFVFVRRRNQKQEKSAIFEPAGGSPNGSDYYNHAAAATAATAATADTADHNNNNNDNEDYPTSYQQHNDYYNDQHAHYQDPTTPDHKNNNSNSYAAQHAQDHSYYSNDYSNGNGNGYGNGYNNSNGYYDTTNGGDALHESMMMQNLDQGNGGYVPPPPHPASATPGSGHEVYSTSPRASNTFPQSLRRKSKGWGTLATSSFTHPQELISSEQLPYKNIHHNHHPSSSQYNDKTEFDSGEELEPPASYATDFAPRRSMTPPRATMQSYREEFKRPSFEREPRRSGSDRGSISGMNTGMNNMRGSDNGTTAGAYGFNNNSSASHVDYDQQGEQLDFSRASQDSPEGARRRARAAELFSAEGTRRLSRE
ncbi:hypothetical protein BGX29_002055 [Mortierella sp. GBA35]|nr:hypothetical protein BGX29_002055 [Mortierella sp. GBA35]